MTSICVSVLGFDTCSRELLLPVVCDPYIRIKYTSYLELCQDLSKCHLLQQNCNLKIFRDRSVSNNVLIKDVLGLFTVILLF